MQPWSSGGPGGIGLGLVAGVMRSMEWKSTREATGGQGGRGGHTGAIGRNDDSQLSGFCSQVAVPWDQWNRYCSSRITTWALVSLHTSEDLDTAVSELFHQRGLDSKSSTQHSNRSDGRMEPSAQMAQLTPPLPAGP
jgi:hypothetical protein